MAPLCASFYEAPTITTRCTKISIYRRVIDAENRADLALRVSEKCASHCASRMWRAMAKHGEMWRDFARTEKQQERPNFFKFGLKTLVAGARNQRYLQLWSGAA
jgi:hypothetical protein